MLQPGTKTKVGPGPAWPASIARNDTPSPASPFRSRIPEVEPAPRAAALAVIPAIRTTIDRGNNFTAKLISRVGHRQRAECGSMKKSLLRPERLTQRAD